ncbi:MAG TPA: sensor histidine kinase, partial [Gammaproteobacteria bacterium]
GGTVQVRGKFEDGHIDVEIRNPLAPEGGASRSGRQMALENVRERLELAWPERAGLTHGRDGLDYKVHLHFPYEPAGQGAAP